LVFLKNPDINELQRFTDDLFSFIKIAGILSTAVFIISRFQIKLFKITPGNML